MIRALSCDKSRWKGCDAVRITNGIVELIALLDGGHLACFRFIEPNGPSSQNVFWEAPWALRRLNKDWTDEDFLQYGDPATGRFLAGFTGHALCLDYFGEPQPEKAALGLGLHGEAATMRWDVLSSELSTSAHCRLAVTLPASRLRFERVIQLCEQQSIVYIEETLYNQHDTDLQYDWVQHVTFGPPFLSEHGGTLLASAVAGMTSSLGYDGRSMLPTAQGFTWPFVRLEDNKGRADLRLPFTEAGKGFLAGTLLDPSRETEFLLAVNWGLRLGVGYCFRKENFPCMAVWEENCARQDAPWNGKTRARGMEFGTTPLPQSFGEHFPHECFANRLRRPNILPRGKRRVRYIMFLFEVPRGIHSIDNVVRSGDILSFFADGGDKAFSTPAKGCENLLA